MPLIRVKLHEVDRVLLGWFQTLAQNGLIGPIETIESRIASAKGFLPLDIQAELEDQLRLDSSSVGLVDRLGEVGLRKLDFACNEPECMFSSGCPYFQLCARDLVIVTGETVRLKSIVAHPVARALTGIGG